VKRYLPVPVCLVAIALPAPSSAGAATIAADRACYGPGQPIVLSGAGFTPSGQFALSTEGRQLGIGDADPNGAFRVGVPAPEIAAARRVDDYTATDQANLAITATVPVTISSLAVSLKPARAKPNAKRRIEARGFTTGKYLWAHIWRGKKKRHLRIGKLEGACGTVNTRKRLFPADAPTGLYYVQFDSRRRYSASTLPQVLFQVTVFRTR
jgi:hypothetical protein